MDIEYTWEIGGLECKSNVGSHESYVVVAYWRCRGVDSQGRIGVAYSSVSFPVVENKPNFIPYADITEEQAIAWTQDVLGEEQVAAIYASIDSQIEIQVNPPVVTLPLPWLAA